jgi:hypothetical protein
MRRWSQNGRVIAASAVACVVLLTACGGALPNSASPTGSPGSRQATSVAPEDRRANFAHLANEFLSGADAKYMSDDQRALVNQAIDSGGISFEEYQTALQNTFDCFDKAGISHSAPPPSNDRGFSFIAYTYAATASGDNPVATKCVKQNSDAIEALYQMQPSSLASKDVKFKAAMPLLVPCMRKGGYLADISDPTIDEVKRELLKVLNDEDQKAPVANSAWSARACMASAGISGF